jgi:hypothetical protein
MSLARKRSHSGAPDGEQAAKRARAEPHVVPAKKCCICLEKAPDVLFLDCMHLAVCGACLRKPALDFREGVTPCLLCRVPVSEAIMDCTAASVGLTPGGRAVRKDLGHNVQIVIDDEEDQMARAIAASIETAAREKEEKESEPVGPVDGLEARLAALHAAVRAQRFGKKALATVANRETMERCAGAMEEVLALMRPITQTQLVNPLHGSDNDKLLCVALARFFIDPAHAIDVDYWAAACPARLHDRGHLRLWATIRAYFVFQYTIGWPLADLWSDETHDDVDAVLRAVSASAPDAHDLASVTLADVGK